MCIYCACIIGSLPIYSHSRLFQAHADQFLLVRVRDLFHVYLNRCEYRCLRLDIIKTNTNYFLINKGSVPDIVK